jgi:hypothetical protein
MFPYGKKMNGTSLPFCFSDPNNYLCIFSVYTSIVILCESEAQKSLAINFGGGLRELPT